MKKIMFILIACFIPVIGLSQHTFSIVAVDSVTGEIGSAGATCLDNIILEGEEGALVISDIILGKGAIHSQAMWYPPNQNAARTRMEMGDSPQEIINWLAQNDDGSDGFNVTDRQYGIVDLNNGHPRTAGYTGSNNPDVANHILGSNYAIQGNILLEQDVLDDMENAFLNETGTLADKLMAAMQGAKRVGADSRCTNDGVSSLSAFLRVAQPDDSLSGYGNLNLDINIGATPDGIDPIDSLQKVYNEWLTTSLNDDYPTTANEFSLFQNYPNPFNPHTIISYQLPKAGEVELVIYNLLGEHVLTLVDELQPASFYSVKWRGKDDSGSPVASGVYLYRLATGQFVKSKKMLLLR